MASKSKTQTVKFEVGQLVEFSGNRVGRVSKIAKNGAIYVVVLGEIQGAEQAIEELRVKKADLQLIENWDHVKACLRQNIAAKVFDCRARAEPATFTLAPEYIPSRGCLNLLDWEGSPSDKALKHDWGIDLLALATEYTGKAKQSNQESIAPMGESIQSPLLLESIAPAADFSLESANATADATYALRELTFSVTRHSILTAFIDVALNKDIPGYHHQVAGNLKNLMAAAFDPVHDAMGYARINTWMTAALELVVKNKNRVAKMLSQPIEAAPIKMDRVTKLGMWIDNMMTREGQQVNDMTSAYDSCYRYDAIGKKLEACTFVVVEVIQDPDSNKVKILPIACAPVYYPEYLTAQSAIKMRRQFIRYYRTIEPDLHLYCGIVPVLETGLSLRAAVEDTMADVIGSLK